MNLARQLRPGFLVWLSLAATSVLADDVRCGPRCLLVASRASGRDISLAEIDQLLPDFERHVSISELETAARELGLATLAVRWNEQLPSLAGSAAILPIGDRDGRRHFVVVLQSDGEHVLLLDFPGQAGWLRTSDLMSRWKWDGNALHVAATPSALSPLQPDVFGGWMRTILPALAVALTLCCLALFRSGHSIHRRRSLSAKRSGMSLVEVLVAMSIMGLLVALFAPAIQASREAARRLQCRNNLKQLMLACHDHHASYGHFPASSCPFTSSSGESSNINLSVHARLLPYLDQTPVFRKLDQNEDGDTSGQGDGPPISNRNPSFLGLRMSFFECPTDRVPAGGTNYRVCIGTGPAHFDWWPDPSLGKVGAFARTAKSDRDMVDGLSSTVFFSEKLVGDQDVNVYTPNRDYFLVYGAGMNNLTDAETACQLPVGTTPAYSVSYGGGSWLFSGYDQTWYNHTFPPNASTPDCAAGRNSSGAYTARSLHDGGVHVAFGDGAVKFVGNSVNLSVWRALSSRKGREPVPSDF